MKRKTFILLIIAGLANHVKSQTLIINGIPVFPSGKEEYYFNTPRPGSSMIKFDFLFPSGNRLNLEFNSIDQLDSIPRIDSLFPEIWQDLMKMADSFRDPLASKRIDYYSSPADIRVRIINYVPKREVYRIRHKEINKLKLEQDTVRIRLFTRGTTVSYYFFNFILNDIDQLPGIFNSGKLDDAISMVKNELNNRINQKKRKNNYDSYYGLFDITQGTRLLPLKGSSMVRYSDRSINLPPTFQAGLQYVRGAWAISVGVGLELVDHIMETKERHYSLIWEPYYFASKNTEGKTEVSKNSFISFRYSYKMLSSSADHKVLFSKSFGIGYLIRKSGNWFDQNTFKVSLSGLERSNLAVEPEFFFHKFFKGFSPSLKFTLSF